MNYHRRSFLKLSAALGAGFTVGPFANGLMGCSATAKLDVQDNFGLQLYTLRDDLPKDPKGVLTQVASFGYKQIESYEGPRGMFWGLGHTGFKKLMDDLGMTLVASHCEIQKDFERKAAEAAAIGMKYLICPWIGPQKTLDDFKRYADTFNKCGDVCKKNGIRFAYHNHDYTFVPLQGQLPQDVLMQNTAKDLVDYEMDIYWVVTAGENAEEWFKKYPGRFRLSHVKDRRKGAASSDKDASVVVGSGSINFRAILKTGSAHGLEHFLVEQEAYGGTTPLAAVKANAAYMKNFRFA